MQQEYGTPSGGEEMTFNAAGVEKRCRYPGKVKMFITVQLTLSAGVMKKTLSESHLMQMDEFE